MNLKSTQLIIDMSQEIFQYTFPFQLESGEVLPEFHLAYTTHGQLNDKNDNVIWIIHALTGDAQVHVWWSGLVGEDKYFDPTKHFIICANLLGSCYGSTNSLSINPLTNQPYFYDFPQLTTRDMASAFDLLRENLGISSIHTLIGGSLGGQVALEWAYSLQNKVEHAIILASNVKASPWIIAFNEGQRMAIESDCTWGELQKNAGAKGLQAARAMAMISYRHPENFLNNQSETDEKMDGFKISSYLRYQGQKLSNRFDAFAYWTLTKAIDSHDLGRGRGGTKNALAKITCQLLAVGVDKDLLYLKEESQYIAKNVQKGDYREIHSSYGHDAFLIEYDQLQYILRSFFLKNN
jgi:homoserine O-acetyltransferase/O-succinyltransferase